MLGSGRKRGYEVLVIQEWTFMVFTPQGNPGGTGFAVLKPNIVLTAAHVVEPHLPDFPQVIDTSQDRLRSLAVEKVVLHPSADVAALMVKNGSDGCFRVAKYQTHHYVGDEVMSVGFPMVGVEQPIPRRVMKGHIQMVFDRERRPDSDYAYKAYELSFPAFRGQSGAPIILDHLRLTRSRLYAAGVVTDSVSYSSFQGDSAEATTTGHWAVGASLDAIGDWLRQL